MSKTKVGKGVRNTAACQGYELEMLKSID